MKIRAGFGKALREVRKARRLTQEHFSDVSSRNYVSNLERGVKSPTLDKVDTLAKAMKVQPLTLLVLAYARADGKDVDDVVTRALAEVAALRKQK